MKINSSFYNRILIKYSNYKDVDEKFIHQDAIKARSLIKTISDFKSTVDLINSALKFDTNIFELDLYDPQIIPIEINNELILSGQCKKIEDLYKTTEYFTLYSTNFDYYDSYRVRCNKLKNDLINIKKQITKMLNNMIKEYHSIKDHDNWDKTEEITSQIYNPDAGKKDGAILARNFIESRSGFITYAQYVDKILQQYLPILNYLIEAIENEIKIVTDEILDLKNKNDVDKNKLKSDLKNLKYILYTMRNINSESDSNYIKNIIFYIGKAFPTINSYEFLTSLASLVIIMTNKNYKINKYIIGDNNEKLKILVIEERENNNYYIALFANISILLYDDVNITRDAWYISTNKSDNAGSIEAFKRFDAIYNS